MNNALYHHRVHRLERPTVQSLVTLKNRISRMNEKTNIAEIRLLSADLGPT